MTSIKLFSQNQCGTETPTAHQFTPFPSSFTTFQNSYNLPIHFYILTSNGVLPGNSISAYNIVQHIRDALDFANSAYAPANISFYPSGFTYHESSSLYNDGSNVASFYTAIHDDDAINVYIVNGYVGVQYLGKAINPLPEYPINNAITIAPNTNPNYNFVLAHELAHYFNIIHTYDGTTYSQGPELDCNLQGDKICDTPQDVFSYAGCPNAIFDCQGNCGSSNCDNTPCVIKDKRINPPNDVVNTFQPDKQNIMADQYGFQCHLDHFSTMQLERIYNELTQNVYRTFLIQGTNPTAVSLPSEYGYVYRTNNYNGNTIVSQFGDMELQLSKTGISPVTSITPSAGGAYIVDKGIFLPQNIVAKISPKRNGTGNFDALNGVTTFDRIKIQQHILGSSILPKPFAWVAADVTNDGMITNADEIEIQQLILGNISSFPNVPSWRLVPSFALQNSVFLSEFNNDPFSAIWTYNGEYLGYNQAITGGTKAYFDDLEINLTNSVINQSATFSFQAIKSGDVNFSAVVNSLNTFRNEELIPQLRTVQKYNLKAESGNCLEAGKNYQISISAHGNSVIYGYQMGITFNPDVINVSGVDNGDAKLFSLDNFNLKLLKEGVFKTAWLDVEKEDRMRVSEKKDLFRIMAIPKMRACDLTQVFNLSDKTLENLFYDENGRLIDLELLINAKELMKEDSSNNLLINVFPNPTSNEINFEIKLQAEAKIDILLKDNFGKTIIFKKPLSSGINRITLNEEINALSSGLIYYSLQLGAKQYTGTFFKL